MDMHPVAGHDRSRIEHAIIEGLGFGPASALTIECEEEMQDEAEAAIGRWAFAKAANPDLSPETPLQVLLDHFLALNDEHLSALRSEGFQIWASAVQSRLFRAFRGVKSVQGYAALERDRVRSRDLGFYRCSHRRGDGLPGRAPAMAAPDKGLVFR